MAQLFSGFATFLCGNVKRRQDTFQYVEFLYGDSLDASECLKQYPISQEVIYRVYCPLFLAIFHN